MPALINRPPRYPTQVLCRVHNPDNNQMSVRSLLNLSENGAFIQTPDPLPTGTTLLLVLHPRGSPVGLRGRVVRLVGREQAAAEKTPQGVGVAFEDITPAARDALQAFILSLKQESPAAPRPEVTVEIPPPPKADPAAPRAHLRLLCRARVMVHHAGQEDPQEVWLHNLSSGGLFVETQATPGLGSVLTVELVAQRSAGKLRARVVHRVERSAGNPPPTPAGLGCAFEALSPEHRNLLQAVLEERGSPPPRDGPALGSLPLMAVVRRVLCGVEAGELREALGLAGPAQPADAVAQAQKAQQALRAALQGAATPQAPRVRLALQALDRLELAAPPQAVATPTPDVTALLAQATGLEAESRLREARDLLTRVRSVAPAHPGLDARIDALTSRLDHQADEDALTAAELLADQPGEELEVRARALAVAKRTASVPLKIRVLHLLMRIGSAPEALQLARAVSQNHPLEKAPWAVMMHIHQRAGHDAEALEAAIQLLRLSPQDLELQVLVERLRRQARG